MAGTLGFLTGIVWVYTIGGTIRDGTGSWSALFGAILFYLSGKGGILGFLCTSVMMISAYFGLFIWLEVTFFVAILIFVLYFGDFDF